MSEEGKVTLFYGYTVIRPKASAIIFAGDPYVVEKYGPVIGWAMVYASRIWWTIWQPFCYALIITLLLYAESVVLR